MAVKNFVFRENWFGSKVVVTKTTFWSHCLVVKALDFQSRGPVFKTTGWLHGGLSLSSFQG